MKINSYFKLFLFNISNINKKRALIVTFIFALVYQIHFKPRFADYFHTYKINKLLKKCKDNDILNQKFKQKVYVIYPVHYCQLSLILKILSKLHILVSFFKHSSPQLYCHIDLKQMNQIKICQNGLISAQLGATIEQFQTKIGKQVFHSWIPKNRSLSQMLALGYGINWAKYIQEIDLSLSNGDLLKVTKTQGVGMNLCNLFIGSLNQLAIPYKISLQEPSLRQKEKLLVSYLKRNGLQAVIEILVKPNNVQEVKEIVRRANGNKKNYSISYLEKQEALQLFIDNDMEQKRRFISKVIDQINLRGYKIRFCKEQNLVKMRQDIIYGYNLLKHLHDLKRFYDKKNILFVDKF